MHKRTKGQMERRYRRSICFSFFVVICVLFTACVMPWKRSAEVEEGVWKAASPQMDSEVIQNWLKQNEGELQALSELGIVLPETSELYGIDLTKRSNGLSFERVSGEKLEITGRKDAGRGYFEGEIIWSGQEICIMDCDTMEYAVLQEDIRSFILGDYYISCRYNTENSELELLIFYCPT